MSKPICILYVDDNPLDLELVHDALNQERGVFKLIEVASQADLESTLTKGGIDLVLSDFNILGFDGLKILEKVHAKNSNLPVVIVTGTGSEEIAMQALKQGAADYIIKTPEHIRRLPKAIHAVFEKKQLVERQIRAEKELRKSELDFRTLAEAMPQIVWITRPDGWNIYFNQRWVDYTGLTLEESYGHGWNKPFHPDDQQRAWDAWQNAIKNRATYSLECRLRRADGVYAWWLIRGVPVLDAQGTILKWFGTCTDINELKLTGEALRESEDKFKYVFDYSIVGKSITLSSGEINVNKAFCDMLGYATEEMKFRKWQELTHPDDVETTQKIVDAIVSGEKDSARFEKRYFHKNGSVVWADVSTKLRRAANGKPLYFMTAVVDISDRKQAEAKLNEQIAELQRWHDATLGRESRILDLKREVNELLGKAGQPPRYPSAESQDKKEK